MPSLSASASPLPSTSSSTRSSSAAPLMRSRLPTSGAGSRSVPGSPPSGESVSHHLVDARDRARRRRRRRRPPRCSRGCRGSRGVAERAIDLDDANRGGRAAGRRARGRSTPASRPPRRRSRAPIRLGFWPVARRTGCRTRGPPNRRHRSRREPRCRRRSRSARGRGSWCGADRSVAMSIRSPISTSISSSTPGLKITCPIPDSDTVAAVAGEIAEEEVAGAVAVVVETGEQLLAELVVGGRRDRASDACDRGRGAEVDGVPRCPRRRGEQVVPGDEDVAVRRASERGAADASGSARLERLSAARRPPRPCRRRRGHRSDRWRRGGSSPSPPAARAWRRDQRARPGSPWSRSRRDRRSDRRPGVRRHG